MVLGHHNLQISTSTSDTNYAVSFEIVFDSIFVIFSAEQTKIWRIGGDTYNTVIKSLFYTQNTGPHTMGLFDDGKQTVTKTVSAGNIEGICSMDFYGLFVQVAGATKIIRLELPVDAIDASAAKPLIKGG